MVWRLIIAPSAAEFGLTAVSSTRLWSVRETRGMATATMIAIGTSLPELVTTLTAIRKKESSLSVGNIIGANVIDLTLILPICSAVSGGRLTFSAQTTMLDLPACLTLCCVAVLPPLLKGKFYRWQGLLMLVIYAAYMVMLALA